MRAFLVVAGDPDQAGQDNVNHLFEHLGDQTSDPGKWLIRYVEADQLQGAVQALLRFLEISQRFMGLCDLDVPLALSEPAHVGELLGMSMEQLE